MEYNISIIIPIYNVEKYLDKCLESLVEQTMKEIEVIMIDDGSTDGSSQIADTYAKKYINFKVIHKDNGGQAQARNIGLRHARGEYILFLDSDDLLPEKACEKLFTTAQKYNADIVMGRSAWKYPDGTIQNVDYLEKWFELDEGKNYRDKNDLAIGCPIVTSKLFKKEIIFESGLSFPEGITGEDVVFGLYTFHKAKSFYLIPDVVYWRTERQDINNLSTTQQKTAKIVRDRLEVIKLVDKYCDKYNLGSIKKHNRNATFAYINRTLEGIVDVNEKTIAYQDIKRFIDTHFKSEENISNYLPLDYKTLKNYMGIVNNKKKPPLYPKSELMSKELSENIKVSVIIPIYNVQEFLREALNSLLNQTLDKEFLEVIMVDDGSTDCSGQIMQEYCRLHKNFKAIHLGESSGAAGRPRNEGLKYATGKYVMYLDPDDKYPVNACEKLIEVAEDYNSEIVIGQFNLFNSSREWVNHKFPLEKIINTRVIAKQELLELPPAIWSKIYRKDLIEKYNITYPEGVIAQDAVFNVETLIKAETITYIPEVVCNYRIRENEKNKSITQKLNIKYFRDFISTRLQIIDLYSQETELDYFEKKYYVDIKYLIKLIMQSQLNNKNEMREVVDIIKPYIEKRVSQIDEQLTGEENLFCTLVRNNEIDNIIQFKTLKHPVDIEKVTEKMKAENLKYKALYNELANSNSWRLTGILRNFKKKVLKK